MLFKNSVLGQKKNVACCIWALEMQLRGIFSYYSPQHIPVTEVEVIIVNHTSPHFHRFREAFVV